MSIMKRRALILCIGIAILILATSCANKVSLGSIKDYVSPDDGIESVIYINFTDTVFRDSDTLYVLIDDKSIGQISSGIEKIYEIKLSPGKHTFSLATSDGFVHAESEKLTFNTIDDNNSLLNIHSFEIHVKFITGHIEVKNTSTYDRVQ